MVNHLLPGACRRGALGGGRGGSPAAALARIAGAGGLELADDPKVLAELTGLKPASKKKSAAKKGTAKKTAAPVAPIAPITATSAEPAAPAEQLDKTG